MTVQRKQCSSCIYLPRNAAMVPALEDAVRDEHVGFAGHRICHHSKDACCRGFWDRHKDDFPAGQIAQRLGWVEFVTIDTLKKKGVTRASAT